MKKGNRGLPGPQMILAAIFVLSPEVVTGVLERYYYGCTGKYKKSY